MQRQQEWDEHCREHIDSREKEDADAPKRSLIEAQKAVQGLREEQLVLQAAAERGEESARLKLINKEAAVRRAEMLYKKLKKESAVVSVKPPEQDAGDHALSVEPVSLGHASEHAYVLAACLKNLAKLETVSREGT